MAVFRQVSKSVCQYASTSGISKDRRRVETGGAGRNRTGDGGFADLGLTTWLPRPTKTNPSPCSSGLRLRTPCARPLPAARVGRKLERETGFEPATSTLARSHSTAELLPLVLSFYSTCAFHTKSRHPHSLPPFAHVLVGMCEGLISPFDASGTPLSRPPSLCPFQVSWRS
jgi:hypothetical protein